MTVTLRSQSKPESNQIDGCQNIIAKREQAIDDQSIQQPSKRLKIKHTNSSSLHNSPSSKSSNSSYSKPSTSPRQSPKSLLNNDAIKSSDRPTIVVSVPSRELPPNTKHSTIVKVTEKNETDQTLPPIGANVQPLTDDQNLNSKTQTTPMIPRLKRKYQHLQKLLDEPSNEKPKILETSDWTGEYKAELLSKVIDKLLYYKKTLTELQKGEKDIIIETTQLTKQLKTEDDKSEISSGKSESSEDSDIEALRNDYLLSNNPLLSALPVCTTSLNGTIIDVNQEFCNCFSYPNRGDVLNIHSKQNNGFPATLYKLIPPMQYELMTSILSPMNKRISRMETDRFIFKTPNKEIRYLHFVIWSIPGSKLSKCLAERLTQIENERYQSKFGHQPTHGKIAPLFVCMFVPKLYRHLDIDQLISTATQTMSTVTEQAVAALKSNNVQIQKINVHETNNSPSNNQNFNNEQQQINQSSMINAQQLASSISQQPQQQISNQQNLQFVHLQPKFDGGLFQQPQFNNNLVTQTFNNPMKLESALNNNVYNSQSVNPAAAQLNPPAVQQTPSSVASQLSLKSGSFSSGLQVQSEMLPSPMIQSNIAPGGGHSTAVSTASIQQQMQLIKQFQLMSGQNVTPTTSSLNHLASMNPNLQNQSGLFQTSSYQSIPSSIYPSAFTQVSSAQPRQFSAPLANVHQSNVQIKTPVSDVYSSLTSRHETAVLQPPSNVYRSTGLSNSQQIQNSNVSSNNLQQFRF